MEDLRSFVESVVGTEPFRVDEVLGDGFVRLNVNEAQRRQAKQDIRCVEDIVVEALRNARDAHASHVYVASSRDGAIRKLTFLDDGDGIPPSMHERVFDPRVTSKLDSFHADDWGVHGRGMALYSVRRNARRAFVAASGRGLGTSVVVEADCSELPERSDQSTWPRVERGEDGRRHTCNGPHNIIRTVLEFALCEGEVKVFLGTPSEIASTLFREDPARLGLHDLLGGLGQDEIPICSRLRPAGDAPSLVDAASAIGLSLSERSAYRIISGSTPAVANIASLERLMHAHGGGRRPIDLTRDPRKLRFSTQDANELAHAVEEAFAPFARRYYLEYGPASVRVRDGQVTIGFDVRFED